MLLFECHVKKPGTLYATGFINGQLCRYVLLLDTWDDCVSILNNLCNQKSIPSRARQTVESFEFRVVKETRKKKKRSGRLANERRALPSKSEKFSVTHREFNVVCLYSISILFHAIILYYKPSVDVKVFD